MATHRERNNLASKRSYEKVIEREHATAYECAMIEEHRKRPHTQAWHWSGVPEDELFEAGYIHDFSKHRHLRLMNKKRAEEGKNRLRDYGLDGLAREVLETGEVVYHGLQAKYYQSKTVTAEDIGSFFAKQISMTAANPHSRGYLYTTTRLQADLADEVAQPTYLIRHVLFPWKHPDRRMAVAPIVEMKETEWPLRDYQRDTLRALVDGRNAICIPCRMGKTVIAGHWLRQLRPRVILAIAPLKVSVENLRERLAGFLPTYAPLLVDSDEQGTTDEKQVEEWLGGHDGPIVVYSTYDSALGVLSQFEWEDAICMVDEAHNASDALCEWVSGFRRCLAMSATFPDEVCEMMGIEEQIVVPFSTGIEGGYLVDYTLWLPSLTRHADGSTSVDEEIPVGFEHYERSMVLKALFHATGMLRTGARRTVVYLSSQAECDQYMEVCRRVFEDYHGVTTLWIEKMTCTVRQAERKAILEAFLGGDGFRILTSVRILDEAVDLPACDSVFITSVGDKSSDIRFFQRAQRGGTLDPKNPNKRNHIFLWAEGWESCVGALSMLREADPEFHRKVRQLPSYDRVETVASRAERVEREREEFAAWSRMACETVEDRLMRKARALLAWVEKEGRAPPTKLVVEGMRLGKLWMHVKGGAYYKFYHILSSNSILQADYERAQRMKEEKAKKGVKKPEEMVQMLLEWVNKEGKAPPQKLVVEGVKLGGFWSRVKNRYHSELYCALLSSNSILQSDYEKTHMVKEENKGKEIKKPNEKARMLLEWVEKEKKEPPYVLEVDGVRLGEFWRNVIYGQCADLYRTVLSMNNILRADYERVQKEKEAKAKKDIKMPEEKARILLKWVEKEGRVPPRKLVVEGVKLGTLWDTIKNRGSHKELYRTILSLNDILRADYEGEGKVTPEEKARTLLIWVEKEGKAPPCMLIVDGMKLGQLWMNVKSGFREKLYRTLLSTNDILRADYEKVQKKREILKQRKAKKAEKL